MSRLGFLKKGKLAWSMMKRKDFSKMKGKDEDIDAVANDMLAIRAVKLAILFREKKAGSLRVSLRSKGGVNAALLAVRYGGGGHADSAGCYIADKKSAVKEFLRSAKRLIR